MNPGPRLRKRPAGAAPALGLALLAAAAAAGAPAFLWVEGESASERSVHGHPWYDRVRRDQLSGGDWLSHYHPERDGTAGFDLEVPERGTYRLWVRANPVNSRLSFRWGRAGDWTPVDFSGAADRVNLAADGKLDLRFLAWASAGERDLSAGPHRIEFRMHSDHQRHGALDAFLLTTDPGFLPQGPRRPGERTGAADPDHFAWEPEPAWTPDRPPAFDLRRLNEERAGQSGFVRREGQGFALGDGTPVVFWAVQGTALLDLPRDRVDAWARRLAAYGVNLVRLDARVSTDWRPGTRTLEPGRLDRIHYTVSALRSQGIYVYLGHVYWARETARLFLCPEMQETYFGWARALMGTPNPYTGLPLAQDPAVAVYEIQNEDSLLFWTFQPARWPEAQRELFERDFGRWLLERHGSLEQARAAWGPDRHPHTLGNGTEPDDEEAGRIRLYPAGHLTGADWAVGQRNPARASDQLRWMVETQRERYESFVRRLREELGVRSLIACSNWKTADSRILDALEHYTYAAGDLVCRNSYFGPRYDPRPERFYRIEIGDRYSNRSALTDPASAAPLMNPLFADRPFLVTECNWDRPNRFRAELPFLAAAYGSLSGLGGWTFFSLGPDPWDSAMNVWALNDTTLLGQFPAAALLFRRGDVRRGPVVVHEALALEELTAFRGSALHAPGGWDGLWESRLGAEPVLEGVNPERMDPLAFFVGRVTRGIEPTPAAARVADLRPHVDRERRIVRSATGELSWDYGTGFVLLDSPRAQGAAGFLSRAGRLEARDMAFESDNEYGTLLAVSLDDRPLALSRRILVQAGTEDRLFGFRTEQEADGARRVADLGGFPLNVRRVEASVILPLRVPLEALVLDGNGHPDGRRAAVEREGRGARVRLPGDALYTLLLMSP